MVLVELLKNIFIYHFTEIMCLRFRLVFSSVETKHELGDSPGRFCIVGAGKAITRRHAELIKQKDPKQQGADQTTSR